MPIVQGQQVPNTPYKYVHIEDFTAGLYNYTEVSTSKIIAPAPQISAIPSRTWGCIGLKSGGLSPMPRMSANYSFPTATIPSSITGTKYYVAFMTVMPTTKSGTATPTQVFVGMQGYYKPATGTGYNYFRAYWTTTYSSGLTAIVTKNESITTLNHVTTFIFGSPYPVWTRTRQLTTNLGPYTTLAFPSFFTFTDAKGHVWLYPNPWTTTSGAAYTLLTGTHAPSTAKTSTSGQIFGFNGRICILSKRYELFGSGSKISYNNDSITYTTYKGTGNRAAMVSTTLLPTGTFFVPENPFGYGCVGSISNGELFMVKKWGGGVYVSGTLTTPSITYLPGVKPTGSIYGRGQPTSTGFFYCVQGDGAYIWNGGNTSQKVSTNINDTFYVVNTPVAKQYNSNFGFFVNRFNNFITFSNNYIFDDVTKAWWSLYPNTTQNITTSSQTSNITKKSFFHYAQGTNLSYMWASPLSIGVKSTQTRKYLWKFTMTKPAAYWQWTSNPVTMSPNDGNVVDVRQLIIRVGCSFLTTACKLVVKVGSLKQIETGTAWKTTLTIAANNYITTFRLNVGTDATRHSALGLPTVVIQLHGRGLNSSGYAPIVHSIDLGYVERAQVGTTTALS
jgi:hypothetical protein